MKKEKIIKFFEIKFKQLVAKILFQYTFQPGYTQDQLDKMTKNLKYKSILEEVEEEIYKFVEDNIEDLKLLDMKELAKNSEYKVTLERQRELSLELVGREYDMDKLAELIG